MSWTLFEILDFETGDSWNGTHGRNIRLGFSKTGIDVTSQNAMHRSESKIASFSPEEMHHQIKAARKARYFKDFCEELMESVEAEAVIYKNLLVTHIPDIVEPAQKRFLRAQSAVQEPSEDKLKKLLSQKSFDINFINEIRGHPTLLYQAVDNGDARMCQVLLEAGADPNIGANKDGYKALARAAFRGNVEIIGMLLDHGASIDEPKKDGVTPLEIAVTLGRKEAVSILLDRGADPHKGSKDPWRLAEEYLENAPQDWGAQHKADAEAIAGLFKAWQEKQDRAKLVHNLARLDRIFGQKRR